MSAFLPSILFVDDDPASLIVAQAYLARYGFNVIPMSSADEALAFLAHHRVQ